MALTEAHQRQWDVVVVGTGMGGATLAHTLAAAGINVLILERGVGFNGDPKQRAEGPAEEQAKLPWLSLGHRKKVLRDAGRCWDEIEDVSGRQSRFFTPHLGWGVGGSSALYGMATERFFPSDFVPAQNFSDCSGSTVPEAWPISYDELRPWYEEAERLYRVRGSADPHRPSEFAGTTDVPPWTPGNRWLHDYFIRQGLNPYHLHMACEYADPCRICQDRLCRLDCKNDAAKVCIVPAVLEHGATLVERCRVIRLESTGRRVTDIICEHGGKPVAFRARIVVLAAGALATPLILHASPSVHGTHTLANESGMVGRNLMRHLHVLFVVWTGRRNTERHNKQLSLNDFYVLGRERGGTLQSFGPLPSYAQLANAPDALGPRVGSSRKPVWRTPHRLAWEELRKHAIVLAGIVEDLPYRDNCVTAAGTSARPAATLHYAASRADLRRANKFVHAVKERLPRGRTSTHLWFGDNDKIAHVCGTCRFGNDPRSSVLDKYNRAHSLDNLYVVDTSFFPSSAGVNPALTVAANALRIGQHLVDLLK